MGFRFRKSIGAGPFRVNFSKSGIGYSFGVKGARITKKSNGSTMTTIGVPGTGISYVKEYSKNKTKRGNNMKKVIEEIDRDKIEIPAEWLKNKLSLTDKEFELFLTLTTYFSDKTFIPREVAAAGCAVSTSIYNNLYNKNVINKNEDKTYSLNNSFINKIGEEYKDMVIKANQPVGHSIFLHLLFGWILLYLPTIYYTISKKHYWHI